MAEREGGMWSGQSMACIYHCLREITPVSQPKDRILIKQVATFNLPTIYYYLDKVFDKNLTEKEKKTPKNLS